MGRIISVVSGKGGVGKTTLSVALSRHLTTMGCRTLLVDTDWGMCSAGYLLESGKQVVYTWQDVLDETASFSQAVVQGEGSPDFLATSPNPVSAEQIPLLARVLMQAAEQYDFVVVDRLAGLDFKLEQTLGEFLSLVVCTPDPMSAHGAAAAVTLLKKNGCVDIRLIVNRFVPLIMQKKMTANLDTLCDQIGAQLLGVVPMDQQAVTDGLTSAFHPNAPYNKAMDRITRRITGESIPLPNLKKLLK
ncbi:MAG: AAA family ATPase [Clostridia bacterium]|nr:AAA family ATPase [Clostridia bacterium]